MTSSVANRHRSEEALYASQVDTLAEELWQYILDEKPELAVYRGIEGRRVVLDSFDFTVYARRKVTLAVLIG